MFDGKFALEAMGQIITKGLPVSALIVAATVLISMPLAFLLGLLRFKRVKGITQVSTVLISFFRGVPLVILIFILYSAMPDVLTKLGKLYGWGIDFYNINRIAYAVFICCLFTVAIMSEIFRSALAAVHANQQD